MTDTTTATAEAKARVRLADHAFIGTDGKATSIDKATGISYTIKGTDKAFTYQVPNATAGSPLTMLALFGARTKATNEASANRQAAAKGDSTDDDVAAISGWFSELKDGTWPADERVGGPRYDIPRLAQAMLAYLKANKKGFAGGVAAAEEKLRTDKAFYDAVRKEAGVLVHYQQLTAEADKAAGKKGLLDLIG